MKPLMCSISAGTSKIMSRVLPRCVSWPFTVVRSVRSPASPISSRLTNHGPSGVQVSRFFTRRFGR